MEFARPLVKGSLIKRYKRFLADIRLDDGTEITAHVANSGAMLGTSFEGMEVWVSPATNENRKLAWDWQYCRVDGHLVGVNTAHPNLVAAEAIGLGQIPELIGYESLRREVKYGQNSRIDILLERPSGPKTYVEVKKVHLKRGDWAEFPDAVTARGTKHLVELTHMVAQGHRAVMLYLIQREDCNGFRPAADIDPVYAKTLDQALAAGVEAYAYTCRLELGGITLGSRLPLWREAQEKSDG